MAVPSVALADSEGTEHVQIVSTNPNSRVSTVIAWGLFTAGGRDRPINSHLDSFVFPKGTFEVSHHGTAKSSFNPKTCLAQITGSGTYNLLEGTGAYSELEGNGTYTLSILATSNQNPNGTCGKVTTAYEQIVRASGPASLGD